MIFVGHDTGKITVKLYCLASSTTCYMVRLWGVRGYANWSGVRLLPKSWRCSKAWGGWCLLIIWSYIEQ